MHISIILRCNEASVQFSFTIDEERSVLQFVRCGFDLCFNRNYAAAAAVATVVFVVVIVVSSTATAAAAAIAIGSFKRIAFSRLLVFIMCRLL